MTMRAMQLRAEFGRGRAAQASPYDCPETYPKPILAPEKESGPRATPLSVVPAGFRKPLIDFKHLATLCYTPAGLKRRPADSAEGFASREIEDE